MTDFPFVHTYAVADPPPMTRRQTYRHYRDSDECGRWDSFLAALMSAEGRPNDYEGWKPMLTVERSDG